MTKNEIKKKENEEDNNQMWVVKLPNGVQNSIPCNKFTAGH